VASPSTTASTRPIRSASSASTARPVNTRSLARDGPTSRASRWVPPPPGMIPSRISGWANLAVRDATRRSQASASSQPAAEAGAVDHRHARPRQPGEPGEQVAAGGALPRDLLFGLPEDLVEAGDVGAGEEGSLPARADDEPLGPPPQGPVLEAVEGRRQVGEHRGGEHVVAVVGNRERQHHEAVVEVFDRQGGGVRCGRWHERGFRGFACPGRQNR